MLIDLFAFLSSISRFPGASEGGKTKLTHTQVNFVELFLSFYGALNDQLDIYFEFRHMRLSALRKPIFGVHGIQEMFFRLAKQIWSRG